jgi:hypothetical protein
LHLVLKKELKAEAGIYIPGDGKALVALRSVNNTLLVAASQNKSTLKLFSANTGSKVLPLLQRF